jgi:uncharacterized protein YndB with AHSA1/START domain
MATIYHQLSINAPAGKVYEAISTADGIGTWWDKQTAKQTDSGLVLEHNPGPEHGVVKLRVVELVPNKRVEWECISTHPKSSPASAWTGTHFIFEIAGGVDAGAASGAVRNQDLATALEFRQVGYDEQSEFLGSNKVAWGQVMQNLKRVVESRG